MAGSVGNTSFKHLDWKEALSKVDKVEAAFYQFSAEFCEKKEEEYFEIAKPYSADDEIDEEIEKLVLKFQNDNLNSDRDCGRSIQIDLEEKEASELRKNPLCENQESTPVRFGPKKERIFVKPLKSKSSQRVSALDLETRIAGCQAVVSLTKFTPSPRPQVTVQVGITSLESTPWPTHPALSPPGIFSPDSATSSTSSSRPGIVSLDSGSCSVMPALSPGILSPDSTTSSITTLSPVITCLDSATCPVMPSLSLDLVTSSTSSSSGEIVALDASALPESPGYTSPNSESWFASMESPRVISWPLSPTLNSEISQSSSDPLIVRMPSSTSPVSPPLSPIIGTSGVEPSPSSSESPPSSPGFVGSNFEIPQSVSFPKIMSLPSTPCPVSPSLIPVIVTPDSVGYSSFLRTNVSMPIPVSPAPWITNSSRIFSSPSSDFSSSSSFSSSSLSSFESSTSKLSARLTIRKKVESPRPSSPPSLVKDLGL